jgi:hypothetical protein
VELNPGDAISWTNLALLCLAGNDPGCASDAAGKALRASAGTGLALVNAALVYEAIGQPDKADAAYRASLQQRWQTALVVHWPRRLPLADDLASEPGPPLSQLSVLLARRLQDEPLQPAAYSSAIIRGVAYAMSGDEASARKAVAAATREARGDPITWDLVALLQRHLGDDDSVALRVGAVTRGGRLSSRPAAIVASTRDIAALRAVPADGLVSGAQRLLSPSPWPWVLEPLLAP